MSNYSISRLVSNRNIRIIRPKTEFAPSLELTLSLLGEKAIENFEWGFIDLYYQLFNGFPECKRMILSYQDFLEQTFQYHINCGEFLYKIHIGAFFYDQESGNEIGLTKLKVKKAAFVNVNAGIGDLHEAI